MPEGSEANFASKFGSTLRRWLRRFFVIILIVFAAIGFLTASLQTLSWVSDGRWTIEEVQRLLTEEETKRLFDSLRAIIKYFWDNGSRITQIPLFCCWQ
jgi:uncharacterized protein involved in exopolysaccharide biosynthesis